MAELALAAGCAVIGLVGAYIVSKIAEDAEQGWAILTLVLFACVASVVVVVAYIMSKEVGL